MQKPDLLRPTLIAGVIFGGLSGLPILYVGNCCCCLWIFATGVLAVWLYSKSAQKSGYPMAASDGALVGLVSGLFAGFIASILETIKNAFMGEIGRAAALEQLESIKVPPESQWLIDMGRSFLTQGMTITWFLVSLLFTLAMFAVLSSVSGLVTGMILARRTALPSIPPPPSSWNSPAGERLPYSPPSPPPPVPPAEPQPAPPPPPDDGESPGGAGTPPSGSASS